MMALREEVIMWRGRSILIIGRNDGGPWDEFPPSSFNLAHTLTVDKRIVEILWDGTVSVVSTWISDIIFSGSIKSRKPRCTHVVWFCKPSKCIQNIKNVYNNITILPTSL